MADKSTQVKQPFVKPQPNPAPQNAHKKVSKTSKYLIFYSELKLTTESGSGECLTRLGQSMNRTFVVR